MTLLQPHPFQLQGAKNLAANSYHLLGDQPGLGKTAQLILAAKAVNASSLLAVVPASVRTHWYEQIEEWNGFVPRRWKVISYDEAVNLAPELSPSATFDVLIPDEAHFLKTVDSQRTRAVFGNLKFDGFLGLAARSMRVWPSTGTFIPNRPLEGWPILKMLHPEFAKVSFAQYAQRYCGAYFDGRAMNNRGASNVRELSEKIGRFMTRRTKRDVWPNYVPPKINLVRIDLSAYETEAVMREEREVVTREALLSPTAEKFSQLGDLARLLRVTGLAKVRLVAEYALGLLQKCQKVAIFYHHTDVGLALEARLSEFQPVLFRGGMNDEQKNAVKRIFVEDDGCRVFLGQIQTAGTGLDGLQKVCSRPIFAEQPWVPGVLGQAIDRFDRMGQRAPFVTADIIHAAGTLESAVLGTREAKVPTIDYLMGDREWRN